MLFLYTGRPSIRSFASRPPALFYGDQTDAPIGTTEDFIRLVKQHAPRYVVQTPMPGFAEETLFNDLLQQVQKTMPSCVSSVYRDETDPRFNVFTVHPVECRSP
jgi:hypothetical protein